MKAEATIKKRIRQLDRFRRQTDDQLAQRIAWELQHLLWWVVADVKGWPDGVGMVEGCAQVIREDFKREKTLTRVDKASLAPSLVPQPAEE